MKQTFTTLTCVLALAWAGTASGQTAPGALPGNTSGGFRPPASQANAATTPAVVKPNTATSAAAPQTVPNGQKLVAEAATKLAGQEAISAKIRQRIDLFGHPMVGVGNYQQLRPATDKLIRLELKIQVGEQATSLQQVCDGRFLWIRREMPGNTNLARVDLRRLQAALDAGGSAAQSDPMTYWLVLGGLPKLISGLESNFQFAAPEATQLAQVPVWMVEGAWKPARLATLWPEKKEELLAGKVPNLDELPEQLPHQVLLTLGRDDLFPYRIEYRRQASAAKSVAGAAAPEVRSIVTMELFEVQLGGEIDPARFAYQPGENEVADHTEVYLKSLGLKTAEKKKAASEKR